MSRNTFGDFLNMEIQELINRRIDLQLGDEYEGGWSADHCAEVRNADEAIAIKMRALGVHWE